MAWPTFTVDVTQNSNQITVYGAVPASEIPEGFEIIVGGVSNLQVGYGTAIMYDAGNNPYSHLFLVRPYTGISFEHVEMMVKPTGSQFNDVVGIFKNGSNQLNSTLENYRQFVEGDKEIEFQPLDENADPIKIKPLQKLNSDVQELIDNGNEELSEILQDVKSQVEKQAMSKTVFFALAEQRKRESAGSGFLEWGKHDDNTGKRKAINSGLWTLQDEAVSRANVLSLGRTGGKGNSSTSFPIALVNGVSHKIYGTLEAGSTDLNQIKFPDAELGTRSYDSETGEVIDYLTDIDPKYGDVAGDLNEAVARNFEGLIKNGDFRKGSSNWSSTGSGSPSFTVTNGVLTGTANRNAGKIRQDLGSFSSGDILEISYTISVSEDTSASRVKILNSDGETVFNHKTDSTERHTVKETITLISDTTLEFGVYPVSDSTTTIDQTCYMSAMSVRKITNHPILSRQDLCFLETWHEKVSDKDIFCPLGNVQYGTSTSDEGVTLVEASTLGVGQGYSAFGAWDTETEGYAAKWSELSTAEQRACLDNPDNNLYFDNEADELIQVRYRIRVIRGLSDSWSDVQNTSNWNADATGYNYVQCKGLFTSSNDLATSGSTFKKTNENAGATPGAEDDKYLWAQHATKDYGYKGLCHALPICLVQRGNQGAYHPVHNTSGFRKWNKSLDDSSVYWLSASDYITPTTSKDCFINSTGMTDVSGYREDTGYINNNKSGNLSQYKFYDAIYAGQVQDLRLNANKQNPNRLMEDAIRKAVAGETRGKGRVPFTYVMGNDFAGTGSHNNASEKLARYSDDSVNGLVRYALFRDVELQPNEVKSRSLSVRKYSEDAVWVHVINRTTGEVIEGFIEKTDVSNYFYIYSVPTGNEPLVDGEDWGEDGVTVIFSWMLEPEYDSLPWVDIVGDPADILATFPNGVAGQWSKATPDGIDSLTIDFTRKCYSPAAIKTNDHGITWSGDPIGLNAVTNSISDSSINDLGSVSLIFYETPAQFTEASSYKPVYGSLGKVYMSAFHAKTYGSELNYTLTGNIAKSQSGGQDRYTDIVSWQLLATGELYEQVGLYLNTEEITLGNSPTNNSRGVKTIYNIAESDGLLYMQYQGRELIHNGMDWGDDYTIRVTNNESTIVDDNGNTVKTFTHTEMFPIGIADYTQTN